MEKELPSPKRSAEIYPSVEIPSSQATIRLLLRSQAPVDPNLFTDEELETLDSAAIIAGQAAMSCYTSEVQTPLDYLEKTDKYRQTTDNITADTKEAGHNTVRQHVHYTFLIRNISRNAIYALHSHPYYNSDMMSQRYVSLAGTSPILPEFTNPEHNQIALEAADNLVKGYDKLVEVLTPTTKTLILERFPGRLTPQWEKRINDEAQKKSQEIARYLLPLGTPSKLWMTVSELTLIRLHHLSRTMPAQPELANIIDGLIATVAQADPSILKEISTPLEPNENQLSPDFAAFSEEIDALIENSSIKVDLDDHALTSKLARAVRLTLSQSSQTLPDAEALDMLLNPKNNKLLSSTTGDIVLDRLSQSLNQINISAVVSLSHVANEQLHRHRIFNHSEQLLLPIPQSSQDYIIPTLLEKNQEGLDLYISILEKHHQTLQELQDSGASLENLQYLLTNATRVRKSISGPFGAFYHFIKARTCLTAQEEIYHMTTSLTQQLCDHDPELGKYLQHPSPCGIRRQGGIIPYCSEGKRFCGIRVWDINIQDFPKRYI